MHGVDLTILVLYLAGSVAVGVLIGRGARSLDGYLLGDRSLPWWAILGSIVATETSTVTVLSIPGLSYRDGGNFCFLQLAMGYILGRLAIIGLFLPGYFQGRLSTAYELLRTRFGIAAQRVTSGLFLLARNTSDGIRLFLSALALHHFTSFSFAACVAIVGIVTILYTVLGGMKSVVWNDCVQLIVYLLGAVMVVAWIVHALPDGWSQLLAYGQAHDKFRLFDWRFSLDATYTFWSGLIGGAFLTLGTHGTDQLLVQRLLGSRSQRGAALALGMSGVVVLLQFALFLFIGVALAAYYDHTALEKAFARNDEAFSWFVVHELPRGVGIIGLLLAAIFAATMSTLSSSLNASATAAMTDFVRPLVGSSASEGTLLRTSRHLTIAFGVLQMLVALAGAYVDRSAVDQVLAIAGLTAGPTLGIFFLGMRPRGATQRGALIGLVAGIATLAVVVFGTSLAWPWYTLVGLAATWVVGALAR